MASKPRKSLENWEIALIKAMIAEEKWNDQDILAYFTRPTRSINHARISAIRNGTKHVAIKAASSGELASFLATWPDVDPSTGLSLRGDELLLKAREAMIAAVHVFNGAGLTFRGELFIVTAIIAWTYLLHAWFKKQGIDYRHTLNENGKKVVAKTANGEDKYWELSHCLKHAKCPLEKGMINNLNFLLELRHEIEHRSTTRIDDVIGPKLQACCINFNDVIKKLFGPQYGLERRLPIALQFVTFGPDQLAVLKKASTLPRHIEIMMENFDKHLTPEELADPRFRFQVAFVQRTANRPSSADQAIEFVVAGTEEAKEIDRILLKEVEKKKYLPSEIVKIMKTEGFRKFNMHQHTLLWKKLDAKKKEKGYGAVAIGGTWGWYENWLARVREECNAHPGAVQVDDDHHRKRARWAMGCRKSVRIGLTAGGSRIRSSGLPSSMPKKPTPSKTPTIAAPAAPKAMRWGKGLKIILGHSGHPLNPRIKHAICTREHSGLTRAVRSGCMRHSASS